MIDFKNKNIVQVSFAEDDIRYILKTGHKDTYVIINDEPYDLPTSTVVNGKELSDIFGEEILNIVNLQGKKHV